LKPFQSLRQEATRRQ